MVMPAYNSADFIETAIVSVVKQNLPVELIIIDDASADDTMAVVLACQEKLADSPVRWKVIRHSQNQGISASRNEGTFAASGKYVAFLDSDDWWAEGKLARQIAQMEKTGAVLCSTGREFADHDGTLTGRTVGVKPSITYRSLLYDNSINCSSVLLRAEVAKEFPMGHDECHEDYITWLRILKKYGSACGINEPLLKYRRSEGSKTANKWKSAKMHYNSLQKVGIGPIRAGWYFCFYAVRGVCKHMGK